MKLKDILLLICYTTLFSFLIFIAKNYFFWGKENLENTFIEENYIEPTIIIEEPLVEDTNEVPLIEREPTILNSAYIIRYTFIPTSFSSEKDIIDYKNVYDTFLHYDSIEKMLSVLDIELHKEKWEVRWRMQNKKVKMFWLYEMKVPEFLAVGIHEFSHFLDLYILKKSNWIDISDYFYEISWDDIKILKSWLTQADFVSGYAMTNKYEDFAESFTYYVLHNEDFFELSKESSYLRAKYDFFSNYVFVWNEFKNFWILRNDLEIKDYYRDITKISYTLEKFLQYLKN